MPITAHTVERMCRPFLSLPVRLLARRRGIGTWPPKRILLLRHDRIGDWVITTPLVDELCRAFPGAEIDVLASSVNAPLVAVDDRISRVHVWSGSPLQRLATARRCRSLQYDAAIQLLLGETTIPALLLRHCAPRALIVGNRDPRSEFLFDRPVETPGEHFAVRTVGFAAGLIAGWTTPPAVRYTLRIPLSAREDAIAIVRRQGLESGQFVLINISAGTSDRDLDQQFCIPLVKRLREHWHVVAVTGAPKDRDIIDNVCRQSGGIPLVAEGLVESAALYDHPLVVVTPDTAMVHIAAAARRPTVALYNHGQNPPGWRPLGVPHRILVAPRGTTIARGLDIAEVLGATLDVIAESTSSSPANEFVERQ